ncbi:MAG: hypothetical protein KJ674_02185 [Nanoarchaeota archaeon]|nr:hypothetical protein [Nanoarchaeota archaeon]
MKKILFLLLILLFINSCSYFDKEVVAKINDDLTILSPLDKGVVSGLIIIGGLSNNLEYVDLQIDLDGWNKVNGVDEWYYSLDTKELDNGDHVLYVRGFDGEKYTIVRAVRIKVNN